MNPNTTNSFNPGGGGYINLCIMGYGHSLWTYLF
jgi:hypothetical protein